MKKVKKDKEEKKKIIPKVKHYYRWKNAEMVHIQGNFIRNGFNISRNKVNAILKNIDELKKFTDGDYTEKIKELKDDEVLELWGKNGKSKNS